MRVSNKFLPRCTDCFIILPLTRARKASYSEEINPERLPRKTFMAHFLQRRPSMHDPFTPRLRRRGDWREVLRYRHPHTPVDRRTSWSDGSSALISLGVAQ